MQRSGTKRCAIWKVWESASHLVLPTRGAALLASSNTADQGSVSDLTASVGSSALDAFFSSGFGSSRELTSASGFVSGSVLSLSSCSVFWRLCKFWLKRGFLAGDSRSSLLWHTIWSGDTATWTWEQISRAILRAKPWQYDAQKRDTRWTPKPGNRWLPSMRWCWCWLWHNFWSNSKNTCLEVVNTWLLFRMKRSVCGMRSPNWHMSKMALSSVFKNLMENLQTDTWSILKAVLSESVDGAESDTHKFGHTAWHGSFLSVVGDGCDQTIQCSYVDSNGSIHPRATLRSYPDVFWLIHFYPWPKLMTPSKCAQVSIRLGESHRSVTTIGHSGSQRTLALSIDFQQFDGTTRIFQFRKVPTRTITDNTFQLIFNAVNALDGFLQWTKRMWGLESIQLFFGRQHLLMKIYWSTASDSGSEPPGNTSQSLVDLEEDWCSEHGSTRSSPNRPWGRRRISSPCAFCPSWSHVAPIPQSTVPAVVLPESPDVRLLPWSMNFREGLEQQLRWKLSLTTCRVFGGGGGHEVSGRFHHKGLFLGVPLQHWWWSSLNGSLAASRSSRWIDIQTVKVWIVHPERYLRTSNRDRCPGFGPIVLMMDQCLQFTWLFMSV